MPEQEYRPEDFATRRDAEQMAPQERVAEMHRLSSPLSVPLADWYQRLEELVGRPVYQHEIALAWNELVEEAGHRQHPDDAEIIRRAERSGKPVTVFVEDGPDKEP